MQPEPAVSRPAEKGAVDEIVLRQVGVTVQFFAADAPAFHLDKLSTVRREALVRAHEAIGGLFFGPRRDLAECASEVRAWIEARLR